MPRPRAPIATRLRNKTKNNQELSSSQNESQESCPKKTAKDRHISPLPRDKDDDISQHKRTSSLTSSFSEDSTRINDSLSDTSISLHDERFPFSTRSDPDIYMDELHSPLSFVRGTSEELDEFLNKEQERITQAFGSKYNPRTKISTFYQAQISPSVPSKRTRHQSTLNKSGSSKKRKN